MSKIKLFGDSFLDPEGPPYHVTDETAHVKMANVIKEYFSL